jgi:spore coat protein CotH
MAKSHFVPVPTRLGTPGRENSVRLRLPGKNLGPVISDVRHSPALPAPAADVEVRARISDPDGIASATLEWRLDETPETGIQAVPLEAAGDGIHTATIPGQALNKIVVFRIAARDQAGNESRYPMDESARSYPLRTHPANLAPTGSRTNPPRKHLSYQHVQYTPDPVRSYRLIFSRENWAYLQGRPIMSNDLVPATFVYNDAEAYYNVGVRFGNSPWTRPGYSPSNQSYRVKFGKDRTFQGWRKFKIDNQRNENLMDERVAWYLFKANASHSPQSSPCYLEHIYCQPYVSFNSTQTKLVHIYDHMEVPAAPFLDKWFPEDSDGVLFKVDDRFEVDDAGNRSTNIDARLLAPPSGAVATEKESYRWFFMHRARDKFDDFSELIEAAHILDPRRTPNPAEFSQKVFEKFNVEQMARTWALSINIDDWDTWGTTRGKNCYLYKTRVDGRWNLIPWDKDLIFGNASGLPVVPGNHSEVARILNSPNGKRIYQNILSDMLQDFWTPAYVNFFFSEVVQTAPNLGSYARGANFLSTRAGTIRTFLGAQPPAFQITNPPADVVTLDQPTIVVSGSAPLGIWTVQLQIGSGTPVLLDPVNGGLSWSGTRWTTRAIDLPPGTTELSFLAFGAAGDLRGEDSITTIVPGESFFTRGDTDRNAIVNLTDAIVILNHLFQGVAVANCHDALDTDDTGVVDMTDAIYLLDHLFRGGPSPPAPYPDPGADGTQDELAPCA